MKIVKPSAVLEYITPNAAQFIERAGRTCYKSEDKITNDSAKAFCAKLKSMGHLSVFEHASATFRVVCDRGVSHEIVRHRISSFSQESTRYCNYAKEKHGQEITVICPSGLQPCAAWQELLEPCSAKTLHTWRVSHVNAVDCHACDLHGVWREAMEAAEEGYMELTQTHSVPPQIARGLLPNNLKTEVVWTANFREWMQVILPQRAQAPAHPQMVEIVGGFIKPALLAACPEVFAE